MPQHDQQYLVITALGRDRAGIVNAITRHAGQCDCNIEDSRLAIFGEEFTFIMMLSGSWNAVAMLESTLPVLAAELDLLTVMKRTQRGHQPAATTGVSARITVADAAGLVERFTNLFMKLDYTLAELVSKTRPDDNSTSALLEIQITAHHPTGENTDILQHQFTCLCAELQAEGNVTLISH
ncbi:ACT domain-containing protein [Morganella psychrotolerans]|uniref:ACT domain-containing protein n=1 Tax=Morganella psychrotolerans TaxID=368603 RepID=UPI0039AF78C3